MSDLTPAWGTGFLTSTLAQTAQGYYVVGSCPYPGGSTT